MKFDGYAWSFGERMMCLSDPDGQALGLQPSTPWDDHRNPFQSASSPVVGPILSIELQTQNVEEISRLLCSSLGFYEAGQSGPVTRYQLASLQSVTVDVVDAPTYRAGRPGVGIADRVAWSVADAATLVDMREGLLSAGYDAGPVLDRHGFKAVSFDGPENLKLAIATVDPGLLLLGNDADADRIVLPPWLESRRGEIEGGLANGRRRG
jgi:glyoxalase family protein